MIIIDASVAAELLLTEAETDLAERLFLQTERLGAPAIIRVEVAGALIRAMRSGRMESAAAQVACKDWSDLLAAGRIELYPIEDIFDSAVKTAFELQHTLMDCLHVALATRWSARLITADRTLFERASRVHQQTGLLSNMRH